MFVKDIKVFPPVNPWTELLNLQCKQVLEYMRLFYAAMQHVYLIPQVNVFTNEMELFIRSIPLNL